MANTVILLKRAVSSGAVPDALANGELGLDYWTGNLWFKSANGDYRIINAAAPGSADYGTVNVNGTLLVSAIQGDILRFIPGTNITIDGFSGNDTIRITAADTSGPAFDKANAANVLAFTGSATAVAAFGQANSATITSSAAFDKANAANVLAFVGGADAAAAFGKANAANLLAFGADIKASAGFDKANAANLFAFTTASFISKAIAIPSPVAGDNVSLFFTDTDVTVRKVSSVLQGIANSNVVFTIKSAEVRSNATPKLMNTAGFVCANTAQGVHIVTFDQPRINANSWVWVTTSFANGGTTELAITISYGQ